MRCFSKVFSVAVLSLALCACRDQTGVQRDYVVNRSMCQSYAESNIGRFIQPGQPVNVRARNAKLVTLFSDCMFEKGWTVATPEREDAQRQVAQDDLGSLNDVPAGTAIKSQAPAEPTPNALQQPTPLISGSERRVPSQQFQQ